MFDTYVRSILVYWSELLTVEEPQPLEEIDDMLLRTFLKELLKIKSVALSTKHKKRLRLILHLPSLGMEVAKRCIKRVDAWGKRGSDDNAKVALHDRQSIDDIHQLAQYHSLQVSLRNIEGGEDIRAVETKQWEQLESERKGANAHSIRHIHKSTVADAEKSSQFPRSLRDASVDAALK